MLTYIDRGTYNLGFTAASYRYQGTLRDGCCAKTCMNRRVSYPVSTCLWALTDMAILGNRVVLSTSSERERGFLQPLQQSRYGLW